MRGSVFYVFNPLHFQGLLDNKTYGKLELTVLHDAPNADIQTLSFPNSLQLLGKDVSHVTKTGESFLFLQFLSNQMSVTSF